MTGRATSKLVGYGSQSAIAAGRCPENVQGVSKCRIDDTEVRFCAFCGGDTCEAAQPRAKEWHRLAEFVTNPICDMLDEGFTKDDIERAVERAFDIQGML